jgi:hypothetical protein
MFYPHSRFLESLPVEGPDSQLKIDTYQRFLMHSHFLEICQLVDEVEEGQVKLRLRIQEETSSGVVETNPSQEVYLRIMIRDYQSMGIAIRGFYHFLRNFLKKVTAYLNSAKTLTEIEAIFDLDLSS